MLSALSQLDDLDFRLKPTDQYGSTSKCALPYLLDILDVFANDTDMRHLQ